MTLVALFTAATKLAGALVTLTVAANAFSFSRYRNKNLLSFRSPIDESSETLAVFDLSEGENGFFFGLATAPAHVEDRLDDAWLQFAVEKADYVEPKASKQPVDALMGSAAGDGGSQTAGASPRQAGKKVKKGKKPLKIAMEAMIRGFEKYIEVEGQEEEQEEEEEEEEKEVEVVDADYDYDKLREFGLSFEKILTSPSLEKCTNDYFLPESDEKGDDHDHDDDHDDTLEATWRAIMEGQGKTMKPQLKKSDTWSGGARISKAEPFQRHNNGQGYGGGDDDDPVIWAQKELRKSETFNDRASLRREKSMTPEELNLRAEAFIKNFNNQMKLQRLESYQRYMKMVNGRA